MTRAMAWSGAVVALVLGALAIAFGCVMWLASLLVIDPGDEVPASSYVVPLVVGALPWIGLYLIWVCRRIRQLWEQPEAGW